MKIPNVEIITNGAFGQPSRVLLDGVEVPCVQEVTPKFDASDLNHVTFTILAGKITVTNE